MSNHVIHSQKMILTVESQQDWDVVQAQIGDFCNHELPVLFNSVFDQVSFKETIRIDKLSLDLGKVPLHKLTEVMKEQIHFQLLNQLKSIRINHFNNGFTLDKNELQLFKNAGRFTKKSIRIKNKVSDQVETHINDFEALVCYCETGTKPWWISSTTYFQPAKILFNLYQHDIVLFKQLVNSIKDETVFFNRIKQLINKPIFFSQYLSFTAENGFLKFFETEVKSSTFKNMIDFWLVELILAESKNTTENFGTWLKEFIKKNPAEAGEVAKITKSYLLKSKTIKKQNGDIEVLEDLLKSIHISDEKPLEVQVNRSNIKANQISKNVNLILESLIIENAGLVIIHPFFKNLFQTLGLLSQDFFKDEISQHKAIIYLHYFVFNEYPEDECQLLLNKILCGANPETVIDFHRTAFSKQELLEAEELKKSVISHWSALRSTSTKSFTDSFLARTGSLNFKDGNWNLSVERNGIDILLERLPWGISTIKLPWNKYLIHISW